MRKLHLNDIIQSVNGCINNTNSDIYINGISTDTREDLNGKLYIALEGDKFDGHDFINQAVDNGAVAIIIHKDINVNFNNIIKVNDTKQALIDIATYYRSLFDIKVVGVTGSVGKTTTKDMIASVVSQKYNVLKTNQNLNNEIGVSKTILNLDDDIDVVVIEMGMCNFGEISLLSNIIKPDIGVITNIGICHIESLKSQYNIFKAKMEILDGMKFGSTLILNRDNQLLKNYNNEQYQLKYYSVNSKDADIFSENICYNLNTTDFDIIDKSIKIKVKIPCLGEHNVGNALAAYLVGRELDIPINKILDGLEKYLPSGMRQKIVNFNEVVIIEDCYNANPDSMKAAVKTLSQFKSNNGRKIMVISDMLELGDMSSQEHYNIGRMIADSNIDQIYCFGVLSKYYVKGALDYGMKQSDVKIFKDKSDLTDNLKLNIKPGDILWFKASRGMELEEVLEKIYDSLEK